MTHVTTPKEFFGFQPGTTGEIARWDKMVEYFYLLEKETDRIQVTNMGPSTLGHPFLKVIITSPENLENLETYRQISLDLADPRGFTQEELDEKIEKGKAVCVQSMSIHGAEIGLPRRV